MGETQQRQRGPSRLGIRHAGGEIVEVQGGHIVRSTGRKDRHSKVCTAKGPRDRRVRLSAHTAIQFYDVQDRLGYDRPSKAVDWLIKKAKSAIDELDELPPWDPTATSSSLLPPPHPQNNSSDQQVGKDREQNNDDDDFIGAGTNHHFLPPSLDSDSIADTIKSFFPMGAATGEPNSSTGVQFHPSFPAPDLLSRTSSHSQDLRLSLQSFENPIFSLHHHHHSSPAAEPPPLFEAASSGWSDHQFQRMVAWNPPGGGGFEYNTPPPHQQLMFGGQQQNNNQFVSSSTQRGPLQSSNNTHSIRAWNFDPITPSSVVFDQHNQSNFPIYPPSLFQGGGVSFSGFRIPARIQGDEEEHDGISDKPSSASSDSIARH